MPREVRQYLEDILQAIRDIEQYAANAKDFDEFSSSAMRVHAILYNLEIIGEAVKNIPATMKKKHSYVEWRKMAGLRDIVAHEYFGISLEIVWGVIKNNLPVVKDQIEEILREIEE
ncbi:MAG: DUF86 domain-containing protein [Chloroflexota bacterium]